MKERRNNGGGNKGENEEGQRGREIEQRGTRGKGQQKESGSEREKER